MEEIIYKICFSFIALAIVLIKVKKGENKRGY